MPKASLPLPYTMSGTFMSPKSLSYLHNCYNVNGAILPREGMQQEYVYNDGGNPTGADDWHPRGIFTARDGTPYCIFGERCYTTSGSALSLKGTVTVPAGLKYKSWGATGFTGVAISTGSKNYFIDDATSTLAEITDTDLPDVTLGVVYLQGRYVWVTSDAVYFSDVDDPTSIDALAFFDAEEKPDENRAIAVLGSDLYVFGSDTIERFRNVGPADAPFVKMNNATIQVGYVGGLISMPDRICFIGRSAGGGLRFYEIRNGSMRIISNDTVNELLNNQELISHNSDERLDQLCTSSFNAYGRTVLTFASSFTDASIDISLYAIENGQGGYNWGFISDNPENTFTDFQDWGFIPMRHSISTFTRRWTFSSTSTSIGGFTLFQRGGSLDAAGLYIKADAFKNSSSLGGGVKFMEDWTNATGDEAVSRGYRTFIREPLAKEFTLNSMQFLYSKQGAYNRSSNSVPTGGDVNDVLNLRFSLTGVQWGYASTSSTAGKDWEITDNRSFGDLEDKDILLYAPTGALLRTKTGWLGMIIETDADIPFTTEQVITNVG